MPSAGPPCFLDPALFGLNVIDGDEASIFPDQRAFLERLDAAGHTGIMNVPGTTIELTADGSFDVTHPFPDSEVAAIFDAKRDYLERYQADWMPWLDELKTTWPSPDTDVVATLKTWWEPLLAAGPDAVSAGRRQRPDPRLPGRRIGRRRRHARHPRRLRGGGGARVGR